MLRFLIFNEYKNFVIGDNPLHELTPLEALLGGMTAGCLAVWVHSRRAEDAHARAGREAIYLNV